ncbi:MAG: FHA domain-containing protein [Pseudomonadota bacterium]
MSKVLIRNANGITAEYLLDRERITIGRKAHNDIRLSDSSVSGDHAAIIAIGNDFFLEDLDSTNGTRVNRKPVKKCLLRDGDEIRIARHVLVFSQEAKPQNAPDDTVRDFRAAPAAPAARETTEMQDVTELQPFTTMLGQLPTEAVKPVPEAVTAPTRTGAIQILIGPGSGRSLELTKPITTLGKPGVQVAAISRRGGGYYFSFVEGTELPLVNGIPAGVPPAPLRDGDIIEVAGTSLGFFLK